MTAIGESPDLNDRAADRLGEPDTKARQSDQDQLDLFKALPTEGPRLPLSADLALGCGDRDHDGERNRTGLTDAGLPKPDLPERGLLDAAVSDLDGLRRLEASIRWLQDESGVRRLPRAATLPPVHGLPPFGAELRANAGPRVDAETYPDAEVHPGDGANLDAPPYPLDRNRLLPPRSLRRHGGTRGFVKFLIASAVAAPPAYFIANAHSLPTLGSIEARLADLLPAPTPRRSELVRTPEWTAAVLDPETTARRATPATEDQAVDAAGANAAEAKTAGAAPAAPEPRRADLEALPAAAPPENAPAGSAPAGKPQPSETAPRRAEPALSARDVALLVERGRGFFEAGDLAAARLLFRRAANSGDASAALAMGTTYDPAVLANHLVRGMGADLDEARSWYEKARELGSPEGPRRLEMLAHR
jgi:hypothetical protein